MEADNGGNNSSHASKQRLRWTHELHERFVDAVAQLGGPDSEFPCFVFLPNRPSSTVVILRNVHNPIINCCL